MQDKSILIIKGASLSYFSLLTLKISMLSIGAGKKKLYYCTVLNKWWSLPVYNYLINS